MLYRAGLTTEQEYLGQLGKSINTVEDTPGKELQSLFEASFDAWIKHYRPDENSPNSRISYYVHGSIVAFLLDIHIRKLTDEKTGLDLVMRSLWNDIIGPDTRLSILKPLHQNMPEHRSTLGFKTCLRSRDTRI